MQQMKRLCWWWMHGGSLALVVSLLTIVAASVKAETSFTAPQAIIRIPGGTQGIGFDDIGYMPALGKVSIPAGQTGMLILIDPSSRAIADSYSVTTPAVGMHGHDSGTSSAVYGDGYIFASDHGMPGVAVLDAHNGKLIQNIRLAGEPDYVRYLQVRHELWVTEPRAQQIQVFSVNPDHNLVITLNSNIRIKGGPESLVFDSELNRAYTNLWKHKTVVIDIPTRTPVAEWNTNDSGPPLIRILLFSVITRL